MDYSNIEDVFSRTPSSFQNIGIYLLTGVLFLFIILSLVVKFPNRIVATFTLYTMNPPISTVANFDSRVATFFFEDGDTVEVDDIVGVMYNALSHKEYCQFREYVYNFNMDSMEYPCVEALGRFTGTISRLNKSIEKMKNFKMTDSYQKKKVQILKKRLKFHQILFEQFQHKTSLYLDLQGINNEIHIADSNLFKKNVISLHDKEGSRYKRIASEIEAINSYNEYIQLQLEQNKTLENLVMLEEEHHNKKWSILLDISETIELLKGEIKEWEELFLLKATISGSVFYGKSIKEGSNVSKGEIIYSITPKYYSCVIGEVDIPFDRTGEITIGSKVIMKFYDYPFNDFGVVESSLNYISPIADSSYVGKVVFEGKDLYTNQKKEILVRQNMKGVAEIITEERSLFYRIFRPLLYSVKLHTPD
jgi:HlyD family secretion protein